MSKTRSGTTLITRVFSLYALVKSFWFSLFALYNPGVNCRHHPTCSVYAKEAMLTHGLYKGGWLALKRLSTCHPFSRPIKH